MKEVWLKLLHEIIIRSFNKWCISNEWDGIEHGLIFKEFDDDDDDEDEFHPYILIKRSDFKFIGNSEKIVYLRTNDGYFDCKRIY